VGAYSRLAFGMSMELAIGRCKFCKANYFIVSREALYNMTDCSNQREDYDKFLEIFYKYEKQIYYEVKYVLRDEQLAEDAVQEVCYKILKYFHKIEESTEFERSAYIRKVTKSAVNDILRQNHKFNLLPGEISLENFLNHQSNNNTEKMVIFNEDLKILKKLSKKYSRVLILKIIYNLTFKEIAYIEKISESAARKRFERGKRMAKSKTEI